MTPEEYIEASGVPESMWPNFRAWYNWFKERDLVGVVRDHGEILGVALARCVRCSEVPDHYEHDEAGESVFVDLTVTSIDGKTNALSRKALQCLLSILWDRFGPRRRITFKRNGAYKEYDYNHFMRKAMA